MSKRKKNQIDIPGENETAEPGAEDNRCPFADESNRFPIDQLLRKHGFRIVKRQGKHEPIWADKKGHEHLQGDALLTIDAEKVADAEYLEYLENQGLE